MRFFARFLQSNEILGTDLGNIENYWKISIFSRNLSWKLYLGHPNLYVFLTPVESEVSKNVRNSLRYSNLS